VLEIVPPSGSWSEVWWNREIELDAADMPFIDVLDTWSASYGVKFDTSLLPVRGLLATRETPFTLSFRGVQFKNALATILDQVGCKASIQGETIVVEPQ